MANPSKSKEANNRYVFECDALGKPVYYCVCLTKLYKFHEKAFIHPTCQLAMQQGVCPAMEMRKDELDAGAALYYEPPHEFEKDENYEKPSMRFWGGVLDRGSSWGSGDGSYFRRTIEPKPAPKPKLKDEGILGAIGKATSFADVVSKKVRDSERESQKDEDNFRAEQPEDEPEEEPETPTAEENAAPALAPEPPPAPEKNELDRLDDELDDESDKHFGTPTPSRIKDGGTW